MLERARSSPRTVVAIAAGVVLILAWIGWAIYVTSSNGATAGLGVVIAWPAMLAALALISLPFIGGYILVRRLSEDSGTAATTEADPSNDEPQDDESEDSDEEEPAEEEERDEDDEEDEDEEPDSEPEASKAS